LARHLTLDSSRFFGERCSVQREIKLAGGEISMLKALGLSGTPLNGKMLLQRVEMETAEAVDTLSGLITLGYVLSTKVNLQTRDDVERSFFRVDSSHARELRDALRPGGRRREERPRRERH
jgi:hypothetical protein